MQRKKTRKRRTTTTNSALAGKAARLRGILAGYESVLVAFSGGVDSAYLAVRAHRVLGDRALAVTAVSPSLADAQRAQAADIAARFGLAHVFVDTSEVDDPRYARNDGQRCYWCKTELFLRLLPLARERGLTRLAYGLIRDDLADFRPGHRAAAEAGVVSPLADAGLGKDDVRALSRAMGLPTWDLPASPCLSSRVPYGTVVTAGVLRQVERAEANVRALGFREFRVRHLGETGRVEIGPDELARLQDPALVAEVGAAVRAAGYRDALVDQEGYRRGRLNDALSVVDRRGGI
jgi:pyridinium-3,5-biscarboxylic acid mononucleotide sulfurtransferase